MGDFSLDKAWGIFQLAIMNFWTSVKKGQVKICDNLEGKKAKYIISKYSNSYIGLSEVCGDINIMIKDCPKTEIIRSYTFKNSNIEVSKQSTGSIFKYIQILLSQFHMEQEKKEIIFYEEGENFYKIIFQSFNNGKQIYLIDNEMKLNKITRQEIFFTENEGNESDSENIAKIFDCECDEQEDFHGYESFYTELNRETEIFYEISEDENLEISFYVNKALKNG